MQRSLPLIAINGIVDQQVSPLDRGFTYGDGVFETCRMINGRIPLWDLHRQRLLSSCTTLRIPLQINVLEQYLQQLIAQVFAIELREATVKIIVTRGEGGRGYSLPDIVKPTLCIGIFPSRVYPEHYASHGVTVRICQQRLGCSSTLAGLKHLNRLEHILARAEWADGDIAEGLLLDNQDHLIEATVSNIFIVNHGVLFTPELNQAGVAGVMRRFIVDTIAQQLDLRVVIKTLTLVDLYGADEIFLSNSLFAIWPVTKVISNEIHTFPVGAITARLQQLLQSTLPRLSPDYLDKLDRA